MNRRVALVQLRGSTPPPTTPVLVGGGSGRPPTKPPRSSGVKVFLAEGIFLARVQWRGLLAGVSDHPPPPSHFNTLSTPLGEAGWGWAVGELC